ncbi:hypothetical protein ACFL5Z_16860 [Planctomycetota bacterium]
MKSTTFGGGPTPKTGQISEEELRASLDAFEEYLRASVEETIDKINKIDTTAKTRRTSLMIQMRTSQAVNAMLEREDPVVAFIELWGFIVRLHEYLEKGTGRSLFGDNQHMFTEMAAQFDTRVEAIGRTFMSNDVFEKNSKHVYSFARSNPIKASFSNTIVYSTIVQEGKAGPLESVINIPLAPMRAMEGVDRTATAVDRFTDKAARFSNIVEELPESVRWQLLALLYDFEETEMTKSFMASLSQFSESSARLAETTKNLPQEIREQTSILVEEIDNKQTNLQATLNEAQKTLGAADQTLAQADKTVDSFQATVAEINQVATAWERAANSTQQVLGEFSKLKPKRKDPPTEPTFKIEDVRDIVETVNQAVGTIQNVTAQIHGIVESEQLANYASMPDRFVNLLVWRLGQLIALIFALALIGHFVIVRIRSYGAQSPTKKSIERD